MASGLRINLNETEDGGTGGSTQPKKHAPKALYNDRRCHQRRTIRWKGWKELAAKAGMIERPEEENNAGEANG